MAADGASSDLLGTSRPIAWKELCAFDGTLKHDVEILDKNGLIAGNVVFKTEFKWHEYAPPRPSPKLDKRAKLKLIFREATFFKDADTLGKQDAYIQFMFQGK